MNSLSLAIVCGCFTLLLSVVDTEQAKGTCGCYHRDTANVQYTDGIKCYSCAGSGCGDPFEADGVRTEDCTTSCLKVKTSDDTVARSCSPISLPDDCEDKDGNEACGCGSDLCNGSTGLAASVAALTVVMVVTAIFNRL